MFFTTTKHILLNICPTGDDRPLRITNSLVWTFALAFELQKAHGPLLWGSIQPKDLALPTNSGGPSKDGDPGSGPLFPNPNGVLFTPSGYRARTRFKAHLS
jgi:hypothetical protein